LEVYKVVKMDSSMADLHAELVKSKQECANLLIEKQNYEDRLKVNDYLL
jgi:hypothetical protein